MQGRIENESSGGSIVTGAIGTRTWVRAFTLLWLVGATLLGGALVIAAVAGLITGTPTIRDGSGQPVPGPVAVVGTLGTLVLFDVFGIGLPWVARWICRSDPARLRDFLVETIDGTTAQS
jgi:hypothetical protein